MTRTSYQLLWVTPTDGAIDLRQLNRELQNGFYSLVMFGTSLERKALGQTAISPAGAADVDVVIAKLKELGYTVVDREVRYHPQPEPWHVELLIPPL